MARLTTTTTAPQDFIGLYGARWKEGLLSEHLELFIAAGGVHRPSRSDGAGWAVIDRRAIPVVCSEIVEVWTEDGRMDGRCGANALAASGTCPAHDFRVVSNPI